MQRPEFILPLFVLFSNIRVLIAFTLLHWKRNGISEVQMELFEIN